MRRAGCVAMLCFAAVLAQEPEGARQLEAIREKLVALDLEGAKADVNALLGAGQVTDATRASALALRAGAHVAGGDLDLAEADYRAVLALDPSFTPEPAMSTKKSSERFARLRASMVGTLHLEIDPPDARLFVDDRPVASKGGAVAVLAGERRVRAERTGFDAADASVRAVAGAETIFRLQLVPNARGIVVRTDIAGVEVFLDDAPVGLTAARAAEGPAELLLADLPIGEHALRLAKPCFATERLTSLVTVDLADRAPKALPVVAMRPAATRVTATGASYPGELRVDGSRAGTLPLESFSICPGTRALEVVAGGRVVWSGSLEAEDGERTLDLTPRPNVVLVGAEWPASFADFAGATNRHGRLDPPPGADLTTREGWRRVALPVDTDLGVAVVPSSETGAGPSVWLYGVALDAVAQVTAAPPATRPTWTGSAIGADLVDAPGGVVLVARVAPGDVAERAGLTPGTRVVAVGGTEVDRAAVARTLLDAVAPGAAIPLRVATPRGEARAVPVIVRADPRPVVPQDPAAAILRSAWAAADGAAGGDLAPPALANLAAILESGGRWGGAAEAWRRAKAGDPAVFGARADYAQAAVMAAQGRSSDAIELLRKVRASAEGAGDAVLAAAAADRLADLGAGATAR